MTAMHARQTAIHAREQAHEQAHEYTLKHPHTTRERLFVYQVREGHFHFGWPTKRQQGIEATQDARPVLVPTLILDYRLAPASATTARRQRHTTARQGRKAAKGSRLGAGQRQQMCGPLLLHCVLAPCLPWKIYTACVAYIKSSSTHLHEVIDVQIVVVVARGGRHRRPVVI